MAVPLFCASLAMSLDGFIAREDGGVDWLNDYFTPEIDWEAFSKRFGAVVVGRRTFDQSIARGIPLGGDQPAVVLTHQPLQETPNVYPFSGQLVGLRDFLGEKLAAQEKDVWLMGGGSSLASLHDAGLVDEWEVSVIPVLLGTGIRLFPGFGNDVNAKLRLSKDRVLSNGIVVLTYHALP